MKAIMILFDSLNRHFLPNYDCDWTIMPEFKRLGERAVTFDNFYGCSMPCMPARRELHTGRYNFLHSSWCPMQPFDDSLFTRLKAAGIYSHICTDHFHYWEDGGSGYLTKYDSCEIIRGQQGDPWKGQVAWPTFPDTLSARKTGQNWRHDWVNRSFLNREEDMPQRHTFESGLDFIKKNAGEDNWFLQIETFDPHEPFFTQPSYKRLYHDDYHGKNLDWPVYGRNEYGKEATTHVRLEYAALLSMCDRYLGQVLDAMDEYGLWEDTMLIVNTDHGFMLGEKGWMGKNILPLYNEIIHIPFFLHDPRCPRRADGLGGRRSSLSQTVDIAPTLAQFFGVKPPMDLDGRSLRPVIERDETIREGALFGIFGGHVNVTDGRYVYMRSCVRPDNGPIYEYTLMPNHMNWPFTVKELENVRMEKGFPFMQGAMVMKIPGIGQMNPYEFGSLLFDLKRDPEQVAPIEDGEIRERLKKLMKDLMLQNQAPREQFERIGL